MAEYGSKGISGLGLGIAGLAAQIKLLPQEPLINLLENYAKRWNGERPKPRIIEETPKPRVIEYRPYEEWKKHWNKRRGVD